MSNILLFFLYLQLQFITSSLQFDWTDNAVWTSETFFFCHCLCKTTFIVLTGLVETDEVVNSIKRKQNGS